jgi:nicotinamidase-related amidase
MSDAESTIRSPELMSAGDTALVVIDVQEKLAPAVAGHAEIIWNIRRLIDGARVLGIPVVGTEQYPQGLGPTVPELADRLGPPVV